MAGSFVAGNGLFWQNIFKLAPLGHVVLDPALGLAPFRPTGFGGRLHCSSAEGFPAGSGLFWLLGLWLWDFLVPGCKLGGFLFLGLKLLFFCLFPKASSVVSVPEAKVLVIVFAGHT